MSFNNNNNELTSSNVEENTIETTESETETNNGQKPHIIRRNIEDYLAEKALKKRLTDIFDDDFLLD